MIIDWSEPWISETTRASLERDLRVQEIKVSSKNWKIVAKKIVE